MVNAPAPADLATPNDVEFTVVWLKYVAHERARGRPPTHLGFGTWLEGAEIDDTTLTAWNATQLLRYAYEDLERKSVELATAHARIAELESETARLRLAIEAAAQAAGRASRRAGDAARRASSGI